MTYKGHTISAETTKTFTHELGSSGNFVSTKEIESEYKYWYKVFDDRGDLVHSCAYLEDAKEWIDEQPSIAYEISQEQAEAILQLRLEHHIALVNRVGQTLKLVCRGVDSDFKNYTVINIEHLDDVASNSYEDYQLWVA
jgi:hypothetical protein